MVDRADGSVGGWVGGVIGGWSSQYSGTDRGPRGHKTLLCCSCCSCCCKRTHVYAPEAIAMLMNTTVLYSRLVDSRARTSGGMGVDFTPVMKKGNPCYDLVVLGCAGPRHFLPSVSHSQQLSLRCRPSSECVPVNPGWERGKLGTPVIRPARSVYMLACVGCDRAINTATLSRLLPSTVPSCVGLR